MRGLDWLRQAVSGVKLGDTRDLSSWRKSLIEVLVTVVAIAAPVSFIVSFPIFVRDGHYLIVALDVAIWLWALLVFTKKQGEYRKRAWILLTLAYVLVLTYFVALGPGHARPGWIVALAVIAALLFGPRAVVAVILLNAVSLVVIYAATGTGSAVWVVEHAMGLSTWLMFVVNISFIALIVAMPVGFLLRGLDNTINREKATRDRLESEQRALKSAHRALIEAVERRHELEDNLRQAQKLEAIGRFASSIAHDLNNILAPVMAYADLIKTSLPPESPAQKDLDQILVASERGRDLTKQIQSYGRDVGATSEQVDLADVMDDLMAQVRPTLPADIAVDTDIERLAGRVFADRNAVFQVLMNLATNAVNSMEDGGGRLRLMLRRVADDELPKLTRDVLEWGRDYACVEVRDTGCGMDGETAEQIFDPFFTTKPFGEGTGLGLATARSIVSALSGTITLETEVNVGYRFCVYLPLQTAPVEEQVEQPTEDDGRRTFSGRVLVVDDENLARTAIARQLRQLGLSVEVSSNGAQALKIIEESQESFGLLITDLVMPDINGLELSKLAQELQPGLPTILVSGYSDEDAKSSAKHFGVDVVMSKPFTFNELRLIVQSYLGDESDRPLLDSRH